MSPAEIYVAEAKKHGYLSAEEEKQVGKDLLSDDLEIQYEARQRLYESHILYAMRFAYRYQNSPHFDDLVNESVLGLIEAAENFDPQISKFTTFAYCYINQKINLYLGKVPIFSVPSHVATVARQLDAQIDQFINERGVEPDYDDMAKMMNKSHCCVQTLLTARRALFFSVSSFDNADRKDENTEDVREEVIAGIDIDPSGLVEEKDNNQSRQRTIRNLFKYLDERESVIINLFFGFDGLESKNLKEIGKVIGMSRERVRQIKNDAIEKMRALCSHEDEECLVAEYVR